MPFNGSGGTSQPANSIYPATGNTLIESAKANASIADLYSMFANVICKDGQTTITANLPMATFKLTGLGAGTAAGHSVRYEQVFTTQALTDAATISWAATAPVATVTLGGNRTMAAPSGLLAGGLYTLIVTQDATGGRTLTWNAVFKGQGGAVMPQPEGTIAAVTQFNFISDGTNLYSLQCTPFIDTNYIVRGGTDPTKKLRFEVDGFTTATMRVLTPPNFDGTIATLAGTETFTNKTLTSPVMTTPTLGVAAATSINFGQTALSNYTESTWTPSLGGTATYAGRDGRYTRIGRWSDVEGYVSVTLIGTGSTTNITGSPVTSGAAASSNGSVSNFSGLATNVVFISARMAGGGSTINISSMAGAANVVSGAAIFGNSARVDFNVPVTI